MTESEERAFIPTDEAALPDTTDQHSPLFPEPSPASAEMTADGAVRRQHAEAGRKGGHRVHQLIQEGRLYEQEHGLKSGRQRLRQLIELGKLYEQEHGLRPRPQRKRRERLSRTEREELVTTFLRYLLRLAKPSFRTELTRLLQAVQEVAKDHAA